VPAARLTEPDPLKDAELRPVTVGVIAIEVPAAFFRVADAEVIVVKRAPPDAPPEKAYATEAVVAPAGIVIEPDGAEIETAGAAAWAGRAGLTDGRKGRSDIFLPLITTQPPAKTNVPAGMWATLSVAARGASPLRFQWVKNKTNVLSDGGEISGSATGSLVVGPLQAADAGSYSVIITNDYGAITSSIAILTVTADTTPPGIAITSPAANAAAAMARLSLGAPKSEHDLFTLRIVLQLRRVPVHSLRFSHPPAAGHSPARTLNPPVSCTRRCCALLLTRLLPRRPLRTSPRSLSPLRGRLPQRLRQ